MNPILRNIIAVVAGIFIGGAVNMFLITISASIIPLPPGIDPSDMESLKENMHLFEPKNFVMPFLAHALGTLVGAFLAALIAANSKRTFALVIGFFFLLGGIANVFMLPGPIWFAAVDIILAYIPMALLGYKLASSFSKS